VLVECEFSREIGGNDWWDKRTLWPAARGSLVCAEFNGAHFTLTIKASPKRPLPWCTSVIAVVLLRFGCYQNVRRAASVGWEVCVAQELVR